MKCKLRKKKQKKTVMTEFPAELQVTCGSFITTTKMFLINLPHDLLADVPWPIPTLRCLKCKCLYNNKQVSTGSLCSLYLHSQVLMREIHNKIL